MSVTVVMWTVSGASTNSRHRNTETTDLCAHEQ
jgi:hypothetical protein